MNPDDDRDRRELESLAERIRASRPIPRAGFRSELQADLLARASPPPRPQRLRLYVAGYLCAGIGLIAVVAAGAAGIGPIAA